jgi:hypothetical protein
MKHTTLKALFLASPFTYWIHRRGAIVEPYADFTQFLDRLADLDPHEVRSWYVTEHHPLVTNIPRQTHDA